MIKRAAINSNTQTQLTSTPRSLLTRLVALWRKPLSPARHMPSRPTNPAIIDFRLLQSFLITEDDLANANAASKRGERILTHCLVATALTRIGYSVRSCSYNYLRVDGLVREMVNAEQLVSDYTLRKPHLEKYLPFVVEMRPGHFADPDAPSVLKRNESTPTPLITQKPQD